MEQEMFEGRRVDMENKSAKVSIQAVCLYWNVFSVSFLYFGSSDQTYSCEHSISLSQLEKEMARAKSRNEDLKIRKHELDDRKYFKMCMRH